MESILVTGSNGFVGRKLKEKLLTLGYNVIDFNSNNGDIRDAESLKKLDIEKVSHIFHLAAKTFVPDSWIHPKEFYETNTRGTLNILEICRQYNKSLTYISSCLYGQPEYIPISEKDKVRPKNPYAHSKYLAEELCKFYSEEFGIKTVIIRPFNIYGIGQNENFLIPHIIKQVIHDDVINVKDLEPRRDYIYLEDVVDALILTMKVKDKLGIYNIGSGYSISVKQIIDNVQQLLKTDKPVISENSPRKNEVSNVVADITSANEKMNWFPKYSFIDGLKEIIINSTFAGQKL